MSTLSERLTNAIAEIDAMIARKTAQHTAEIAALNARKTTLQSVSGVVTPDVETAFVALNKLGIDLS